jgi:hypothetical protein
MCQFVVHSPKENSSSSSKLLYYSGNAPKKEGFKGWFKRDNLFYLFLNRAILKKKEEMIQKFQKV